MRSFLLLFPLAFVACASSPPKHDRTTLSQAIKSDGVMNTFEANGYKLAGAEYWPYVGTEDAKYPEDVMWGFYPKKGVVPAGETDPNPNTASRSAVACAERAYHELEKFIANHPADFDQVVDLGKDKGITRSFYLWTNDYSHAATPFPPGVRKARLWYWKRKQHDPNKPDGYWKWESVLDQQGVCTTPSLEDAVNYLQEKKTELAK